VPRNRRATHFQPKRAGHGGKIALRIFGQHVDENEEPFSSERDRNSETSGRLIDGANCFAADA
jgi:hypothetical protein